MQGIGVFSNGSTLKRVDQGLLNSGASSETTYGHEACLLLQGSYIEIRNWGKGGFRHQNSSSVDPRRFLGSNKGVIEFIGRKDMCRITTVLDGGLHRSNAFELLLLLSWICGSSCQPRGGRNI